MDTYRATNTLNGKFYIGSSVNFKWRKYQHLCSEETYPFQTDLRKNPEAFVWEVYTDNLDTNEHEAKLLKEFFFDVKCYNLNSSAERPPNQTGKRWWKNELIQKQTMCFEKPEGEGWEEGFLQKTKKKQSEAVSEERKKAQSERMLGGKNHPIFVPWNDEQKQAKSESMSGKSNPNYGKFGALHPNSKAIIAIEPDGTESHYGGVREATRELGIERAQLSRLLKSGHSPKWGKWKGWQFLH
jgi:group I intron endonuclease